MPLLFILVYFTYLNLIIFIKASNQKSIEISNDIYFISLKIISFLLLTLQHPYTQNSTHLSKTQPALLSALNPILLYVDFSATQLTSQIVIAIFYLCCQCESSSQAYLSTFILMKTLTFSLRFLSYLEAFLTSMVFSNFSTPQSVTSITCSKQLSLQAHYVHQKC